MCDCDRPSDEFHSIFNLNSFHRVPNVRRMFNSYTITIQYSLWFLILTFFFSLSIAILMFVFLFLDPHTPIFEWRTQIHAVRSLSLSLFAQFIIISFFLYSHAKRIRVKKRRKKNKIDRKNMVYFWCSLYGMMALTDETYDERGRGERDLNESYKVWWTLSH